MSDNPTPEDLPQEGTPQIPGPKPFFSNLWYDRLKFLAQIGLPGGGTLYFALSQIWGLPYGAEVVGTITAVDVFLGLLLGLSTSAYNNSEVRFDGVFEIKQDEDGVRHPFLNMSDLAPEDIETKDVITLKVDRNPPQ